MDQAEQQPILPFLYGQVAGSVDMQYNIEVKLSQDLGKGGSAMASKDLERLVGRTILDAEFRKRLFADPETAIREEGYDLTPDEMAQLQKVDKEKAMALAEEMAALPKEIWK